MARELRIFIHIDDSEDAVASISSAAHAIPTRGDRIWIKTLDVDKGAIVRNIEHQWDLSKEDTFGLQDVILWCSSD